MFLGEAKSSSVEDPHEKILMRLYHGIVYSLGTRLTSTSVILPSNHALVFFILVFAHM